MTHEARPRSRTLAQAAKAVLLAATGLVLVGIAPDGSPRSAELMLAPYLPRSAHHAYGYSLALDRFRAAGARGGAQDPYPFLD